jgi:hypothetical protein
VLNGALSCFGERLEDDLSHTSPKCTARHARFTIDPGSLDAGCQNSIVDFLRLSDDPS